MRKSSSVAGTFMPGYSLRHSGSSASRGPGSSTAPESDCAPTAAAFSSTQTFTSGFSCFRRMAQARAAGPAPTITTSYCMTSRSIDWVSVTVRPLHGSRERLCTHALLGLHADRTVEPDRLAIEHRDLAPRGDQLRELLRLAETRGKGYLRGKRRLHVRRHAVHHRGVKDPGCDRDAADPEPGQLARDRQRHPGDRGLGGRVGRLADLSLEGGDRGRVDEQAPFTVRARRVVLHDSRGGLIAQEGADQIDVDDPGEEFAGHRTVLAEHASRADDAGAVDEKIQAAEPAVRGLHGRVHLGFRGYVAAHEARGLSESGGG